ncbi:iron complex transport system ATP-binding protein [Puniceibacterium sediminis]|uniref:Iron complex transport system ATP-binding protein n=1 Tax=Puniceibacterium sediminis TaxID=1608407 RepID=A0A238YRY2_9RHOB|nr:heme ABC transporter ATP-binding protein [Puniceibacterium sediminis]SNR73424.1 iron complex transport system ATP-binding protein [Puniceibacterium sediminis]
MLRAESIKVAFGRKLVLRSVDFAAAPGHLTAIVGPNGSGKTTLLRALTGEVGHSGTVTLDGSDIARMKGWELAARRAVLPQSAVLAFPFTVIEVVRMGLSGGTSGGDKSVPGAALRRVGMTGYTDRLYQELSGGEQQRVQLARVLAQVWHPVWQGRARWLLLDEPVASLDIAHQLLVMGIARDFANSGGGVVAVMHDLNLTAMFADAVAVMADGQIIAQGPMAQVMTDDTLSRAYGCGLRVGLPPAAGSTFVLPHTARPIHEMKPEFTAVDPAHSGTPC